MRNVLSGSVVQWKERVGILKKTLTSQLPASLFKRGNATLSGIKIFVCHWEGGSAIRSIRPRIPGVDAIQKLTTYNSLLASFSPYTAHNLNSRKIVTMNQNNQ